MEERERKRPETEEPRDEGTAEDVELHKKRSSQQPMASDEAPAEGESDDDVELHRKRSTAQPL